MSKRRITLSLDTEIVEALEAAGGSSLSATANEALAEALESVAHRAALQRWLDELDAKYGAPDAETLAAADAFLDSVFEVDEPVRRAA